MRRAEIRHIWAVSLLVLAGCASKAGRTTPNTEAQDQDQVIQQALKNVETGKQEYRISPQDLVDVSVYQEDDLRREARVTQSGRISFPLLGEIEIGGLTALEAEAKIRDLLKGYLVDPHVSVHLKEYHSRKIFILGEVVKPGSYEIPSDHPLTVVEAIALAGGFTKIAAPDRTRVVRRVVGRVQSLTIAVNEVTAGGKEKDMALQPDDVVFIPQTFF